MGRGRTALLAAGVAAIGAGLYLQSTLSRGRVSELSEADFRSTERAFAVALRGDRSAAPDGMVAVSIGDPVAAVLFREDERHHAGRGEYVIRNNERAEPLLIAAPHRGADRFTGTLAQLIFSETDAAAAGWNSAPRRGLFGERNDVAKLRRHPFTAFALAFAATYPNGRVVQLHGFDPERRRTKAAQSASVILSGGSAHPPQAVASVSSCLQRNNGMGQVMVYPTDVDELGATQNAQGQALREVGFAGFVHVELSLALRRQLVNHAELRKQFAGCLASGL